MRKTFLSLLLMGISFTGFSQIVSIPDVHFKNRLLNHNPVIDTNNDDEIQVIEAEVFTGSINVDGIPGNPGEISDLTGIEAFINLDELKCSYNQITSLDLTNNVELRYLTCNENPLADVNISTNVSLRTVSFSGNELTSLDVSNNTELILLQSNFGNLTSLDVSNLSDLQFLYVQDNQLTSLDLSGNPTLIGLTCEGNQLTHINVNSNPLLDFLRCRDNSLTYLNVSNNPNLKTLFCKNNSSLTYIHLQSGNNQNLNISGIGNSTSNFEDLPNLEIVCLDDIASPLASFIEAQAGHSVTFTEDCTLSLPDSLAPFITIYPNPVEDVFFLTSENPIEALEIYDLQGKLLLKKHLPGSMEKIEVSSLKSGVYFIKLTTPANTEIIKRIIKE